MFSIGDKVVYPMHGAGIIEEIQEKKILGESRNYYILKVPFGDMKIMVPVDQTVEVGIRNIVSAEQLVEVKVILGQASTKMSDNWNRRYRDNMDKLKTGDIQSVASPTGCAAVAIAQSGCSASSAATRATSAGGP